MLVFVGSKMLLLDVYKVPIAVSLMVIVGILATSIAVSWLIPRMAAPAPRLGRAARATAPEAATAGAPIGDPPSPRTT